MQTSDIEWTTDQRNVTTIFLNRPELHNAFNDEVIEELIHFFQSPEALDSRLIILSGRGKSFCAGADLNWMKKMKDYSFEENVADSKRLAALFKVINDFKRPVIARVNGAALGGGVGLVAVCDYVLCVDTAIFGLTEVRLGLLPAVISPYVIAKIGESNARATFLTGSRFSAEKAQAMGLVHQITSFDKIDEDLEEVVSEFLKAAPLAQAAAKILIANVLKIESLDEKIDYTCQMIANKRADNEGQEGMSALLEKRSPHFK